MASRSDQQFVACMELVQGQINKEFEDRPDDLKTASAALGMVAMVYEAISDAGDQLRRIADSLDRR